MLISNFLEYSSNYSNTKSSLWLYSKDEATNFKVDIGNDATFKSFMYKTKLVEKQRLTLHQIITMEF